MTANGSSGPPKVGSVWRSRDRRDHGRLVRVESVDVSFAYVRGGREGSGRLSRVRLPLSRLYEQIEEGR